MITMATLSVPDLFTTDLGFSCPALPHEGGKLGRTRAGEGESLGWREGGREGKREGEEEGKKREEGRKERKEGGR